MGKIKRLGWVHYISGELMTGTILHWGAAEQRRRESTGIYLCNRVEGQVQTHHTCRGPVVGHDDILHFGFQGFYTALDLMGAGCLASFGTIHLRDT